jgi:hypothetical protein
MKYSHDEVCIYVDYKYHLGPCVPERILRLISRFDPPAARILSVANWSNACNFGRLDRCSSGTAESTLPPALRSSSRLVDYLSMVISGGEKDIQV